VRCTGACDCIDVDADGMDGMLNRNGRYKKAADWSIIADIAAQREVRVGVGGVGGG